MIASKIADCFKQTGNHPATGVAQTIHDFLRAHRAGSGEAGGEVADDELDQFTNEPGSVETLVCLHDS